MDVTIRRLNQNILFEAANSNGHTIRMDGATPNGGGGGFRPMELLLAGIGGCSAFDVVELLREAGQELVDLSITVSGERAPDRTPAVFTAIHLSYTLFGKIDPAAAEQALERGIKQQCSVGDMLGRTAEITYSYTIEGA
ncbi:MAG: OsmC family protein [Lentisphaerae bacterium]|nr:OsmC family protein [Lentisphaerota bacterium]